MLSAQTIALHARRLALGAWKKAAFVLGIRRGERALAAMVALVVAALNVLAIYGFEQSLSKGVRLGYYTMFIRRFSMSGFDACSCINLSNGDIYFNTLRHPLFFTLLWPWSQLNQWLMEQTGDNYAMTIMAVLQTVAAVYAILFLRRTLTDVVGLRSSIETASLCALFFGFAYIMLCTAVPDHFVFSLALLTFTVWVSGLKMRSHTAWQPWQQAAMFFVTAGVTLTNGAKTFLAALFCSPRRTLGWRSLLAFGLSAVLLFGVYQYQYYAYEVPQKERIDHMVDQKRKQNPNFERAGQKRKQHSDAVNGTAIDKDGVILKLSDISTPRIPAIVHNLFGESVLFHRSHLLGDVQNDRPVFVAYDSAWSYAVSVAVALLLLAGVACSLRRRLMLMLVSWVAFDALMHIGFGFGLNEVYIMTAHWAFIIPIGAAYLLQSLGGWKRRALLAAVQVLAATLVVSNVWCIALHCLGK